MVKAFNTSNILLSDLKLDNIVIDNDDNLFMIDYQDLLYEKYTQTDTLYEVLRGAVYGTSKYLAIET